MLFAGGLVVADPGMWVPVLVVGGLVFLAGRRARRSVTHWQASLMMSALVLVRNHSQVVG